MLPGLISLSFSCYIQMVGPEFVVHNMKACIRLALSQQFKMLMLVQWPRG